MALKGSTANRPCAGFNDGTKLACFVLEVPGDALRANVQTALAEKRMNLLAKGGNHVVDWDSLCVSPHGFQLRWKRPAQFRTAYAWWKRLLDTVGGGSRSDGLWHVVGKYRVRDLGAPTASKLSDQDSPPCFGVEVSDAVIVVVDRSGRSSPVHCGSGERFCFGTPGHLANILHTRVTRAPRPADGQVPRVSLLANI